MKRYSIFTILAAGVGLFGGLLLIYATTTTTAQVLLPSDLARAPERARYRLRIGGQVADAAVTYTLEPEIKLTFRVQDHGKPELSVPVVFHDLKPDMFAPGRDVLIDGDFNNGVLEAHTLLTQCPSKYEPPSPGDYMKGAENKSTQDTGSWGK